MKSLFKVFLPTFLALACMLLSPGYLRSDSQTRCFNNPDPSLQSQVKAPRIDAITNPFVIGATMPVDLHPQIRPGYNQAALEADFEGMIVLKIYINENGKVLRSCVVKGDPHGLAPEAPKMYLKKIFQPATLDGKPVAVQIHIPIRFNQ